MKWHLILYCALCVVVMSGCSNTSSENVTTAGISAEIDVFANGSGATVVTAELEAGSGGLGATSLELGPGDSLTVMANGIQKTMTEDASIFGRFSYVASFDFDDVDTVFTVSFSRANERSAPNSNVALPDGFAVLSPTSNDVYSPQDSISIEWQPAGRPIIPSIFVSLDCTLANGLPISAFESVSLGSDIGVASVPVAAFMPSASGLDTTRLCEGDVEFRRWKRGNLDPNFGEGGEISAEQFERTRFFVDPGT